jgi:pimeloyl-ACP methyl ester carboxylesterase
LRSRAIGGCHALLEIVPGSAADYADQLGRLIPDGADQSFAGGGTGQAVLVKMAWTGSIGLDVKPTFGRRDLARARRDGDFVIRWHIAPMIEFMPDLAAIREAGIRTVIGAGEGSMSGDYFYVRVARAMADALGGPMVTFPGHHHAYEDRPDAFAWSLAETIGTFGR